MAMVSVVVGFIQILCYVSLSYGDARYNIMLKDAAYMYEAPPTNIQVAYREALCLIECQPALEKIEQLHICVMRGLNYQDECSSRDCIERIVPSKCTILRDKLIGPKLRSFCNQERSGEIPLTVSRGSQLRCQSTLLMIFIFSLAYLDFIDSNIA